MRLLPLLVLALAWSLCLCNHIRCKDPSEENLRTKLLRLAPDAKLLLNTQDIIPDQERKKCPRNVNHTSELIQDRSISPWSYSINEDLNRYPQRIIEAYCLCKGCISTHNKQQNSVVSEPFYKKVHILMRSSKCKKGRFVYKLREIKIAQFCICRFN
ncbi:interleukin-17D [Bombina bombina]|uniref:interleukin-17D n=1 Tax=Bombina bombina TaxID=8345 RepID=UPI00235A718D|nr:interleukin-17D [Bombina bombina]